MSIIQSNKFLQNIVHRLRTLPYETEWVEFKNNNSKPEEIGEYISALANSAALSAKTSAYMLWGIDDISHKIIGTDFKPDRTMIGNEELENWLLRLLSPKIDFSFSTLAFDELSVVLLEVNKAFRHPVRFKGEEFLRVGSYKKKLKDHPEKERSLWRVFDQNPFEKEIAAENLETEDILRLLDYPAYFDLVKLPLPENRRGILEALCSEEVITKSTLGNWHITNFGAVLFAKKLAEFTHLKRKAVRIIQYEGKSKFKAIREEISKQGYAVGFEGLIKTIIQLLPSNEVIGPAFRKRLPMFPELATRELVANAIIHQNFDIRGTSILIELFSDRIEITNPGLPLVKIDRFLDSPPKSRNETIASFMRRINICEERGSGIDKVVTEAELNQLPAPIFRTTEEHTLVCLFSHKPLNKMDAKERVHACYLHASLKYVQHNYLSNSSIRQRFAIAPKNMATASRIIRETLEAGLIKLLDKDAPPKLRKYIPYWG